MSACKTQKRVSDARLVLDIQNSDHLAFKILFQRYYYRLFCYILRGVWDEQTAKDLVQELFLRVWTNRRNLDHKQAVQAYLYRMARNLRIDHLRKHRICNRYPRDEMQDHAAQSDCRPIFSCQLQCALNAMPDVVKETFFMNRFDGLKYAEIAVIYSVSVKTIEARMTKALKILRKNLK